MYKDRFYIRIFPDEFGLLPVKIDFDLCGCLPVAIGHEKKSIPLGEVATLFLGHSLDAYRTGRLVLNPQPRQPAGLIAEVK